MYQSDKLVNKIFNGDSLEVLKEFPSNSVDLVVTSPPYYNLRNYQNDKQIGTEKTPKDYINNLIDIFRECKRVLKKTGSIWVNIADSYNKHKSLIGIPERLVIAMQDELNLIRRNTIIWHKPSCMPSSAKDRFTIDFEYFYFFMKEPDSYYFETQYEPMKTDMLKELNWLKYKHTSTKDFANNGVQSPIDVKTRMLEKYKTRIKFGGNKYSANQENVTNPTYSGKEWIPNENLERIKRTVWSLNTPNTSIEHFATYPEELIHIPIVACTNTTDKSLVLDPFLGSGTTAIKAQKLGRKYVGIELNPKYVSLAKSRLNNMITSYINRN